MKSRVKRYVIGYRLNDKLYTFCSSYGFPFISNDHANIHFNKKILDEQYKRAVQYISGNLKDNWKKGKLVQIDKKFRGGKVFIADVDKQNSEFVVPRVAASDSATKTIALRIPIRKK